MTPTCRGGIIAAGDGSRLRATGFSMPKPLVPVAGVALIDGVIGNFRGAGITSLVIIVNEQARACRDWVHSRFPDLDIEVIVKTTPSSLESFREVTRRLGGDRALISTVDTWCRADDFAAFVHAARGTEPFLPGFDDALRNARLVAAAARAARERRTVVVEP